MTTPTIEQMRETLSEHLAFYTDVAGLWCGECHHRDGHVDGCVVGALVSALEQLAAVDQRLVDAVNHASFHGGYYLVTAKEWEAMLDWHNLTHLPPAPEVKDVPGPK